MHACTCTNAAPALARTVPSLCMQQPAEQRQPLHLGVNGMFGLAPIVAQEEMYSFVTVAEDATTKGKGTVVVQDA